MSTVKESKVDIDNVTKSIRLKLNDPFLGTSYIKKILGILPEHQIYSIAEFAAREGGHPGKLFISVCEKAIKDLK